MRFLYRIVVTQKALFLFDGPNFYKNLKHARLERGHVDYYRLAQNISMGRTIVDVIFFTSPVDQTTDAENYKNQQRFFAALTKSGVTLQLGTLVTRAVSCSSCRARPIQCKRCGREQVVKTEKSVDVKIALKILSGCFNNLYDVVYLASCDSDLVPAIDMVRAMGKQAFLLLPGGARGYAVGSACDTTIPITQEKINAAQVT